MVHGKFVPSVINGQHSDGRQSWNTHQHLQARRSWSVHLGRVEWPGLAWIRSRHQGGGTCASTVYGQYRETAGLSCFVASPRDPFLHKAPRPCPTTPVENQPLKWHDPTPSRSRIRNLSRFTFRPSCAPPSIYRVWSWIMCPDEARKLRKPRRNQVVWSNLWGAEFGCTGRILVAKDTRWVWQSSSFFLRRPSLSRELTTVRWDEKFRVFRDFTSFFSIIFEIFVETFLRFDLSSWSLDLSIVSFSPNQLEISSNHENHLFGKEYLAW